ncbi:MAG TPA: hypothetical protein VK470_12400 [Bacteroidota bacterium]|nr:hypothetical protein [Bacteroidota bacterium]
MKLILGNVIFLISSFYILGCKSPNEAINNTRKWEDVTFNLTGEKLRDIKLHNNVLYLSTYTSIYKYENNNWKEYINVSPYAVADFEFKSDTLFILTRTNKVLYLDDKDSLRVKCSVDRSILPANDLLIYGNDFYIGGSSQSPFNYGLTKISGSLVYNFPMINYSAPYDVYRIEQQGNSIFIGTIIAGRYFVAKMENGILGPIGINANKKPIGECYSMLSFNEKLLVGSKGQVLSFENNQWTVYKKELPTIINTELVDKAISLCAIDTTILVGTINSGVLAYDNNSNQWTAYCNTGLPTNQAINKILRVDNNIFALAGKYNFDDTFSGCVYKINTDN